MKTKMFLFVATIAMIMTSCGSSKKSQNDQMMMMMMQMMQQQQQNQSQPIQNATQYTTQQGQQVQLLDPSTMQSNMTPCERLAREGWMAGKLRGYGTGRSRNINAAMNQAILNARNDMAASINALVQSYMQDYNEDLQQDDSYSNAQAFTMIQEQVVKEMVQGSLVVFQDKRVENGIYYYEACVQLEKDFVETAVMSDATKKGIRLDAEKFREKAQNAWDRMTVERAGENPALTNYQNQQQQQQLDMQQQQINMQQQQHNMNMEQQQMQMQQQQQQHNQNMQQQRMDMRQQQQQHNNNMEQQYMNLRY